jgi:hypothetical protein
MVNVSLDCILKGDVFLEKEIIKKTGLIISSVKQNSSNVKNIYKKAVTIIPEQNNIFEEDYQKLIIRFIELIQPHIRKIKHLGCKLIVLLMTVKYYDQCNFEFTDSILKEISKTFDEFYITCYEEE